MLLTSVRSSWLARSFRKELQQFIQQGVRDPDGHVQPSQFIQAEGFLVPPGGVLPVACEPGIFGPFLNLRSWQVSRRSVSGKT